MVTVVVGNVALGNHCCCFRKRVHSVSVAVAYAQIDWHDFVVVETVDFQQDEAG